MICLFLVLITYSICLTSFSFLISACCSTANMATFVSLIVWAITCIPFYLLQVHYANLSNFLKSLLALFPNTGLALALKCVVRLEEIGTGLHWSNISDTFTVYDKFSVFSIILIMLYGATLSFLCAICVGRMSAGYYKFTPKEHPMRKNETNSSYFEKEPSMMRAEVRIQNLSKRFDNQKLAVDDVTLNIYDGQITVLLGRNGAGKYRFV